MSDKLVSSQYFIVYLLLLGGMIYGGLLCFRQTRRAGIRRLAATCSVVALIVAGWDIAEGGHTLGHVLAVAAGIGFVVPLVGTALACALIGIAQLLWAITRRAVRAIRTFGGD